MPAVSIEGQRPGYLYRITHKESGHDYVGVTIDLHERWKAHRYSVKRTGNEGKRKFARALRKYGVEAFNWTVIAAYSSLDASKEAEVFCRTQLRWGYYNMTDGGEGCSNPSPESRQRKRDKMNQIWQNPEKKAARIAAISNGLGTQESKALRSAKSKQISARPEVVAAKRHAKLNFWACPENKQQASEAMKAAWTEDRRVEFGRSVSARYQNPDYVQKIKTLNASRPKKTKVVSTETCLKISIANTGKKQSTETVNKRKAGWAEKRAAGIKQSPEACAAKSRAARKRAADAEEASLRRSQKMIRINLLKP